MGNLFSSGAVHEPLASRMRPRNLDEYVGQEHIIGEGKLLRRAIQMDQISSLIFSGPPGSGKTTLARVIAGATKSHFSSLNAVLTGVKELREEIEEAKNRQDLYGMKTILFVDEVHRWNRSQQDALLPWVENGTVILIGATTENPYFSVNSALVSRSRVFLLKKLEEKDLFKVAENAIHDKERGYGKYNIKFEEGALEHLVSVASGDARSLLNALELAVETSGNFPPKDGDEIYISKENAEDSIQHRAVLYDKEGDYHFDVISAFIKSLRGSDPDAALYWLGKMVSSGEDPHYIFRRMLILSSEDVGLADPRAIMVTLSCAEAFDRVGMPEGNYFLTEATLYLSTCKKSNSSLSFFDALKDNEKERDDEVPNHLKDSSRDGEALGHGDGYKYPHEYNGHWVKQQYLPTSLQGRIYYKPSSEGYEGTIKDEVENRRIIQDEAGSGFFEENFTFSPGEKKYQNWVDRAEGERSVSLQNILSILYDGIKLKRFDNTLTLNALTGGILFPLMKYNREGLSVAFVKDERQKEEILYRVNTLDSLERPEVYSGDFKASFSSISPTLKFSLISFRNILTSLEEGKDLLPLVKERLEENGEVRGVEALPSLSSRLSDFVFGKEKEMIEKVEDEIYSSSPLFSWGKEEIEEEVLSVFPSSTLTYKEFEEDRYISPQLATSYYDNTYYTSGMDKNEFLSLFSGKRLKWKNTALFITFHQGT